MIPGSVDPRRPEKVQRYKPNVSGNGNAPGEDLTPDYMNILGPDSTRGNVQADAKISETTQTVEAKPPITNQQSSTQQQQNVQGHDEASKAKQEATPSVVNNATNVIPTCPPQYGVAIIPITTTSTATNDILAGEVQAISTNIDSNVKENEKDMHSTPSKNDRFKVVKIASSEPFRRGRWKCMDFVDQTPPATNQPVKSTQPGAPNTVQIGGGVYMQTQSLPPQQIQQLLLQSGLCAVPPQYFQNNMQSQMLPQAQQYFYQPAVQNQSNVPQHLISAMPANSLQAQFMNSNQSQQQQQAQQQQQYFQPNFQTMQFVQPAFQNQNSAFVPTTQNIQNFQQAQTYAGQANAQQQNVVQQNQAQAAQSASPATQPPNMVNGYNYPSQNVTEQQIAASNLPTQVTKNVMINSNPPSTQVQVVQNQDQQNTVPRNSPEQQQQQPSQQQQPQQTQQQQPQQTQQQQPQQTQTQQQPQQQHQQNQAMYQQPMMIPNVNPLQNVVVLQPYDPNQGNDVYANSQFVASVHTLPMMDSNEAKTEGAADASVATTGGENPDDPSKTNPVVNAIDNKIEQAMDLVKSHLMYTVREEVEVLKEKIAELMERIQQLESENNFLRSQLPKTNPNSNGTSEPQPPPPTQQ